MIICLSQNRCNVRYSPFSKHSDDWVPSTGIRGVLIYYDEYWTCHKTEYIGHKMSVMHHTINRQRCSLVLFTRQTWVCEPVNSISTYSFRRFGTKHSKASWWPSKSEDIELLCIGENELQNAIKAGVRTISTFPLRSRKRNKYYTSFAASRHLKLPPFLPSSKDFLYVTDSP